MSVWVTVSELRIFMDVPLDAATDGKLQVCLDSAEAICQRYMQGVIVLIPAPEDLKQVVRELAGTFFMVTGSAGRIASQSVDGSGTFEYIGSLTSGQKATLRQLRIEAGAVAI